jgi:hypothetical protein
VSSLVTAKVNASTKSLGKLLFPQTITPPYFAPELFLHSTSILCLALESSDGRATNWKD